MKTVHGFHPAGYLRHSKFSPGEIVLHATAKNSAGPHTLTKPDASVLLSVRVKTRSDWIALFEARYTFTVRDDPYGQYKILCVRLPYMLFVSYPTPQQDQHSIRVAG